MKKIDLHLHLSFDPVPKSDTLLVSTYKEMLPHLEELGIGKGVLKMCIRDSGGSFHGSRDGRVGQEYRRG